MAPSNHAELETKIGHRFRDRSLLELALTHASTSAATLADNERLEFLGDAVLSLVVSERMFLDLPKCDEGELTRLRSLVVNTSTLARTARRLDLKQYARLGKGIRAAELPPSVYANLFEALIAAVYLDAGIEAACRMVEKLLSGEFTAAVKGELDENYKSVLQQHAQRELGQAPQYRLVQASGPDHGKTFVVSAVIGDVSYPPGKGPNKKAAEQHAAARALVCLGINAEAR